MVATVPTSRAMRTKLPIFTGHVALIAKPGDCATGIGRYSYMLQRELHTSEVDVIAVPPVVPLLPAEAYKMLQQRGIDLRTFFTNYPIWTHYPKADVYHLTSQNLASLLLFRRPRGRIVVTVHDIIPYMMRHDTALCVYRTWADRLFDYFAMRGLHRADHLIADSAYTRQCLIDHLGIPAERVTVVHLGLDHDQFRPQPVADEILARYGLRADRRYLIYVGSEDPRKNLSVLIHALAELRRQLPDVELIKLGRAHFDAERARLVALMREEAVTSAVHFLDAVPEQDLPLLYNLAAVCVMPSLQEGFGFPVLEAQACGTPVVYAAAASLPEIAGGAGLAFDPDTHATRPLAGALTRVLTNPGLAAWLRGQGYAHAQQFTWTKTAAETLHVYGTTDNHRRGHQPIRRA